MRIAVIVPGNREGHVRGGHVQMMRTIQHLRSLQVDVEVAQSVTDLNGRVDLCHVVGLQDSAFAFNEVQKAHHRKMRVVLSPIWWDFERRMLPEGWLSTVERRQPRWMRLAKVSPTFARSLFLFWYREKINIADRRRAVTCCQVDLVLPNSPGEVRQVNQLAGRQIPCAVVRNGVDEQVFKIKDANGERDIPILFVGIVDRTKNVHRLIQAVQSLGVRLVVVGQTPDDAYVRHCESQDTGHLVTWHGALSHEELVGYYNRSRVVVLSSMRETPGLTLLEGAACGSNVVATQIGSAYEYFGDRAEYCDPFSTDSIGWALRRALDRPSPNLSLSEYVRSRFTWALAAQDTLVAYKAVIGGESTVTDPLRTGAFEHATAFE